MGMRMLEKMLAQDRHLHPECRDGEIHLTNLKCVYIEQIFATKYSGGWSTKRMGDIFHDANDDPYVPIFVQIDEVIGNEV
jgi:hypothetical protein